MMQRLKGMMVWCTRPGRAGERSCWRLHELGAELIHAPTVIIEPRVPDAETLDPIRTRSAEMVVGLTSPTNTENFVAACTELRSDGTAWPVVAVGQRTALRAKELGLDLVGMAPRATASDLGPALLAASAAPVVLVPGSNMRRGDLAAPLRDAGREVIELLVQKTRPVDRIPELASEAIGELDALVAFSPSALTFVDSLDPVRRELVQRIPVAVMGPTTGDRARALGLKVVVQPTDPHEDQMLGLICQWWATVNA
jgi:uroporphyrinogen-III synthase